MTREKKMTTYSICGCTHNPGDEPLIFFTTIRCGLVFIVKIYVLKKYYRKVAACTYVNRANILQNVPVVIDNKLITRSHRYLATLYQILRVLWQILANSTNLSGGCQHPRSLCQMVLIAY